MRFFSPVLLLIALLLAAPVAATYAGDQPLTPVYAGTLHGGYLYAQGNSTYSGTVEPGDIYAVGFDPLLPAGAAVEFGRIYLYWSWSKQGHEAVYPSIAVSLDGVPLESSARYVDTKGFVSKNDFFSGVDAFDAGVSGVEPLTLMATNTAAGNATFVLQGAALLLVYRDAGATEATIQVLEGADLLYTAYGITPEMATGLMTFDEPIDTARVASAELFIAAPSGGYTSTEVPRKNSLSFNRGGDSGLPSFIQAILEIIFPTANGKTWTDVLDADEARQVGTDRRDVTVWLRPSGNVAEISDNGDYILLSNAVLEVRHSS
jgi:hypothetical protein